MAVQITVRKGESIHKALRRLKKLLEKDGSAPMQMKSQYGHSGRRVFSKSQGEKIAYRRGQ